MSRGTQNVQTTSIGNVLHTRWNMKTIPTGNNIPNSSQLKTTETDLQNLEDLKYAKKRLLLLYAIKHTILDNLNRDNTIKENIPPSEQDILHEEVYTNKIKNLIYNIQQDSGEGAISGLFAAFALSNLCSQSSDDPEINQLCQGLNFHIDHIHRDENGLNNQAKNIISLIDAKTSPKDKTVLIKALKENDPQMLEKMIGGCGEEYRREFIEKLPDQTAGTIGLESKTIFENLKAGSKINQADLVKISDIKDIKSNSIDLAVEKIEFLGGEENKVKQLIDNIGYNSEEICNATNIKPHDITNYIYLKMKPIHIIKDEKEKISKFQDLLKNDQLKNIIFCKKFKSHLITLITSVLCEKPTYKLDGKWEKDSNKDNKNYYKEIQKKDFEIAVGKDEKKDSMVESDFNEFIESIEYKRKAVIKDKLKMNLQEQLENETEFFGYYVNINGIKYYPSEKITDTPPDPNIRNHFHFYLIKDLLEKNSIGIDFVTLEFIFKHFYKKIETQYQTGGAVDAKESINIQYTEDGASAGRLEETDLEKIIKEKSFNKLATFKETVQLINRNIDNKNITTSTHLPQHDKDQNGIIIKNFLTNVLNNKQKKINDLIISRYPKRFIITIQTLTYFFNKIRIIKQLKKHSNDIKLAIQNPQTSMAEQHTPTPNQNYYHLQQLQQLQSLTTECEQREAKLQEELKNCNEENEQNKDKIEKLNSRISTINESLDQRNSQFKTLNEQYSTILQEKERLEEEKIQLDKEKIQLQEEKIQLQEISDLNEESEKQSIANTAASLKEKERLQAEKKNLEIKKETLETKNEELQKNIKRCEQKEAELQEELKVCKEEQTRLEEELENCTQEKLRLTSELHTSKTINSRLETQNTTLKEANTKLEKDNTKLKEDNTKLKTDLEAEKEQLKKEQEQLNEEKKQLEQKSEAAYQQQTKSDKEVGQEYDTLSSGNLIDSNKFIPHTGNIFYNLNLIITKINHKMYDRLLDELQKPGRARIQISYTIINLINILTNLKRTPSQTNFSLPYLYFLINKIVKIFYEERDEKNSYYKLLSQQSTVNDINNSVKSVKSVNSVKDNFEIYNTNKGYVNELINAAITWLDEWRKLFGPLEEEYKNISESTNLITDNTPNELFLMEKNGIKSSLPNINSMIYDFLDIVGSSNRTINGINNPNTFNLYTAIALLYWLDKKTGGNKNILPLDNDLLNQARTAGEKIGKAINSNTTLDTNSFLTQGNDQPRPESKRKKRRGGKITKKINKNTSQNKNSLHNIIMNHTLKKK